MNGQITMGIKHRMGSDSAGFGLLASFVLMDKNTAPKAPGFLPETVNIISKPSVKRPITPFLNSILPNFPF